MNDKISLGQKVYSKTFGYGVLVKLNNLDLNYPFFILFDDKNCVIPYAVNGYYNAQLPNPATDDRNIVAIYENINTIEAAQEKLIHIYDAAFRLQRMDECDTDSIERMVYKYKTILKTLKANKAFENPFLVARKVNGLAQELADDIGLNEDKYQNFIDAIVRIIKVAEEQGREV